MTNAVLDDIFQKYRAYKTLDKKEIAKDPTSIVELERTQSSNSSISVKHPLPPPIDKEKAKQTLEDSLVMLATFQKKDKLNKIGRIKL